MENNNYLEIAWNRSKFILYFFVSILFLLAGIWLVYKNDSIDTLGTFVAVGCILLGILCIYAFLRKIFDKRPALVIDENGIQNNTRAGGGYFIPWNDITLFYETSVQVSITVRQHFIVVGHANPEEFIAQETDARRQKALSYNHERFGSPICIHTDNLQMDRKELLELLENILKKYSEA